MKTLRPQHLLCLLCVVFQGGRLQGQLELENDSKFAILSAYDTTYMMKYDAALSVGPTLSYRNFNLLVYPKVPIDSIYIPKLKWRSPSNRFWGLDFNYDKFGFTMSFASTPPKNEKEKKGESNSNSFAFSYGGNRCFIEFGAMRFKGFYETSRGLVDSTTDKYYQSPSLKSEMLNAKAWYFTNHREFAFKSSYGGLYRQIKTRWSWALAGNFHVNNIVTDSSVVPDQDSNYFDNALQVRGINAIGLSVMGGGAWNIVMKKHLFINIAWVFGPDLQEMGMKTADRTMKRDYVTFSQDFRFATGFNTKRWYVTFTAKHETNRFINDFLETRIRLNSFSVNAGWRFNIRSPQFYNKFKRTWLYNVF